KIERLYGFGDAVDLSLTIPKESSGLKAPKVTLAKDQSDGALMIETDGSITAGEKQVTVLAQLKFNGQDLKVEQPLVVRIATAK
ncbi:MAG TPA: hypothetical protein VHH73_18285, partial [Verrucomicrobiae bacterium]|nr:hypothetical protein [Verrucomicrobiae bacterium]